MYQDVPQCEKKHSLFPAYHTMYPSQLQYERPLRLRQGLLRPSQEGEQAVYHWSAQGDSTGRPPAEQGPVVIAQCHHYSLSKGNWIIINPILMSSSILKCPPKVVVFPRNFSKESLWNANELRRE